jgi:PilZ domain
MRVPARQELGLTNGVTALAATENKNRAGQPRGGTVGEEARTGKRFPLELPIKIHHGDVAGDAKGVTGNLSAAGVYIRADASMEIGSPVEFEITLPPEMTGGQENVTIQCKGRVVRADETGEGGEGRGVACVIDSYEFVRSS